MYFRSDGNGGYNIHKGTIAMITVAIMMITAISTVVGYGTTIRSDVNHLEIQQKEIAERCYELNKRIELNQNAIIINQEKIIAMSDNMYEIKEDVKVCLK